MYDKETYSNCGLSRLHIQLVQIAMPTVWMFENLYTSSAQQHINSK